MRAATVFGKCLHAGLSFLCSYQGKETLAVLDCINVTEGFRAFVI